MPYVEVWVEPEDCDCPDGHAEVLDEARKLLRRYACETACGQTRDDCEKALATITDALGEKVPLQTDADMAYLAWKRSRQEGSRA